MKDRIVAISIALTLGQLGMHKFYLGDKTSGKVMFWCWIISLVTCWLFIGLIGLAILAIIAIVNAIQLTFTSDAEFNMKYNYNPEHK